MCLPCGYKGSRVSSNSMTWIWISLFLNINNQSTHRSVNLSLSLQIKRFQPKTAQWSKSILFPLYNAYRKVTIWKFHSDVLLNYSWPLALKNLKKNQSHISLKNSLHSVTNLTNWNLAAVQTGAGLIKRSSMASKFL